jgi:uncharacterized protein (TIGR02001 family)
MLKNKLLVAALVSAFSVSAMADDAAPAAPASPFSTNVSLTNNYLYRGISQSGANPAIQGGFDYAGASGLYIGTWGSSISWLGDAGTPRSGLELDTYGGYRGTGGPVSYDVGYLRYNYSGSFNTILAPKADTNEVYGAVTYSIVTAKLSYSLGDLFGFVASSGSTYADLTANYPIGDTGYAIGAHYGKQNVHGTGNDVYTYSDYKVFASKDLGTGYSASLTVSGTDAKDAGYTSAQGIKLGKTAIVAALSRTF